MQQEQIPLQYSQQTEGSQIPSRTIHNTKITNKNNDRNLNGGKINMNTLYKLLPVLSPHNCKIKTEQLSCTHLKLHAQLQTMLPKQSANGNQKYQGQYNEQVQPTNIIKIESNKIQKLFKQLALELAKQQYTQFMQETHRIIAAIFAQLQSYQNSYYEQKKHRCRQLWSIVESCLYSDQKGQQFAIQSGLLVGHVKIQLYYSHIIMILGSLTDSPQLLSLVLAQGWLCKFSRTFITMFIINALNQVHKKHKSFKDMGTELRQRSIYKLCWQLHSIEPRLIEMLNKESSQQQKYNIAMSINDWQYITQTYLEWDQSYQKYKLIQLINDKNHKDYSNNKNYMHVNEKIKSNLNEGDSSYQNLISSLTPLQLQYLQQLTHEGANSDEEKFKKLQQWVMGSNHLNANARYIQYMRNRKNTFCSYIEKQTNIIQEQLINNSYPSLRTLINTYHSLTNLIHAQSQLTNQRQEVDEEQKKLCKLVGLTSKYIHKLLLTDVGEFVHDNSQPNIQHLLQQCVFQKQRLKVYLKFTSRYIGEPLIDMAIEPSRQTNRENSWNMIHLYTRIVVKNILLKQRHQKFSEQGQKKQVESIRSTLKYLSNKKPKMQMNCMGLIYVELTSYIVQLVPHISKELVLSTQICQMLEKLFIRANYGPMSLKQGTQIYNVSILYSQKLIQQIISLYYLQLHHKHPSNQQLLQQILKKYLDVLCQLDKNEQYFKDQVDKLSQHIYNQGKNEIENKEEYKYQKIVINYGLVASTIHLSMKCRHLLTLQETHQPQIPIIEQLLYTRSMTIKACLTMLCQFHPNLQYLPLQPSSLRLRNLHQYNNISIKYSQLTEHNKQYRQTVYQSDLYRNHIDVSIYLECLKICVATAMADQDSKREVVKSICDYVKQQVKQLRQTQSKTRHINTKFYSQLCTWKLIYLFTYYPQILQQLLLWQLNENNLFTQLIFILEDRWIHPLVRQYVSAILGKLYQGAWDTQIFRKQTQEKIAGIAYKFKSLLINKISNSQIGSDKNININVFVPIIFTLGNHMLTLAQKKCKNSTQKIFKEDEEIFQVLLKYVSCHHAYIRSIVQYYIKKKFKIQQNLNPHGQQSQERQINFLQYLCKEIWQKDKDCLKIMKNIGIAVEGFREAMQSQEAFQFLGYQRVQEFPTALTLTTMRRNLNAILNQAYQINISTLKKPSQIEQKYINLLNKNIENKIIKLVDLINKQQCIPLCLHYKAPKVIIIATLLQKVHNFGYIIRTLHKFNNLDDGSAMLLVPSRLPVQHPQCQQFIPRNSQVEVIQIKETQLQVFIKLNKSKGYPLIGLEQCAGSLKIDQFKFPSQYMLLLGNQRLGAPANLLNLADFLVQIQQVGKIRSLNVHVSMVICLWQSLISNSHSKLT